MRDLREAEERALAADAQAEREKQLRALEQERMESEETLRLEEETQRERERLEMEHRREEINRLKCTEASGRAERVALEAQERAIVQARNKERAKGWKCDESEREAAELRIEREREQAEVRLRYVERMKDAQRRVVENQRVWEQRVHLARAQEQLEKAEGEVNHPSEAVREGMGSGEVEDNTEEDALDVESGLVKSQEVGLLGVEEGDRVQLVLESEVKGPEAQEQGDDTAGVAEAGAPAMAETKEELDLDSADEVNIGVMDDSQDVRAVEGAEDALRDSEADSVLGEVGGSEQGSSEAEYVQGRQEDTAGHDTHPESDRRDALDQIQGLRREEAKLIALLNTRDSHPEMQDQSQYQQQRMALIAKARQMALENVRAGELDAAADMGLQMQMDEHKVASDQGVMGVVSVEQQGNMREQRNSEPMYSIESHLTQPSERQNDEDQASETRTIEERARRMALQQMNAAYAAQQRNLEEQISEFAEQQRNVAQLSQDEVDELALRMAKEHWQRVRAGAAGHEKESVGSVPLVKQDVTVGERVER